MLYWNTRPLHRGAEVATVPRVRQGGHFPTVSVLVKRGEGLDSLRAGTYHSLGVIRVFTEVPGEPTDRTGAFTFPIGSTMLDLSLEKNKPEGARGYLRWERP
jgi:ribosome-interacting GTPase 1